MARPRERESRGAERGAVTPTRAPLASRVVHERAGCPAQLVREARPTSIRPWRSTRGASSGDQYASPKGLGHGLRVGKTDLQYCVVTACGPDSNGRAGLAARECLARRQVPAREHGGDQIRCRGIPLHLARERRHGREFETLCLHAQTLRGIPTGCSVQR